MDHPSTEAAARIAIVDYGVGNLQNLLHALRFQNLPAEIVSEPTQIDAAHSHLILPGVGAFAPAMQHLNASGMIPVLERHVARGRPLLGVCVGLQLLFEASEENGTHRGLGWLPGTIRRFPRKAQLKIPQIGWNRVERQREDPILANIPDRSYFYFVHGYIAEAAPEHTLARTEYGIRFASLIRHGTIWGAQFHPEKSAKHGLRLLRNFASLEPQR